MSYKPFQDNQLSLDTHDDIFTKQHKSLSTSISPTLPSFLLSSSDDHPNLQSQALPNAKKQRGNESRNLLLHVLNQLQRRSKPPTVSEAASKHLIDGVESGFGVLLDTVKDVMKVRNSKQDTQPSGMVQDDSDDEFQDIYSTDNSYELMLQLKDVLSMSFTQGWRIFEDTVSGKNQESRSPPRLRSRHSFNQQKRRQSPHETPKLLSTCIAIISSVVLEDCRYKISLPRPSRPPHALQALVINISQFLLHSHLHDATVISQIGFAMVPAFAAFQPDMHIRVLQFFIDLLQVALSCLASLQEWVNVSKDDLMDTETNPAIVSIHVEDPDAMCIDNRDWHTNGLSRYSSQRLLSTTAPQQSLAIYQLGALVPSLLAAILESVDINFSIVSHEKTHHFLRIFELLVLLKGDAYSDLLQIAASQSSKVRRIALGLIAMKWPKAIGHLVITEPIFPTKSETPQKTISSTETEHVHQFTPWYFRDCSKGFTVNGPDQASCQSCTTSIHGFGLLCPFCMCQVHFDCYDDPKGSSLVQYALPSDPHVQRIAMYRFSTTLRGTEALYNTEHEKYGHLFHSVNLFTLSLCFICRKPLWGCSEQGLKCITCPVTIHFACLSSVLTRCRAMGFDSSHMTIDSTLLQQSCLEYYRDILLTTKEALNNHTYEEVSILDATLSIQLQLLTNGVALGSIIILQQHVNNPQPKDYAVEEFELHQLIRWCHGYLISQKRPVSLATEEYMQENKLSRPQHSVMFDWSYLLFMTSTLKAPDPTHAYTQNGSQSLLSVGIGLDDHESCPVHPFTAVSGSVLRGVLGQQFNVRSDCAVRLLLAHLNHLGFLGRRDKSDHGNLIDHRAIYIFPLPLGLDLSSDVENLVGTVEACLTDLDLSMNEYGLLLLIRKLWPNGLASDYGLRRLSRALLGWVLAEDNNLAVIFRDYLTKQRGLPGVRSTPIQPWPSTKTLRPGPNNSVQNGGDYVATRRSLLSVYVIRWLNALHDQDTPMYVDLVWDACFNMTEIDGVIKQQSQSFLEQENKEQYVQQCDSVLRSIVRLSQASVIYNIFDNLLVRWMELVVTLDLHEKPMASLARLFPRETEALQRSSVANIDLVTMPGLSSYADPWRPIMNIAKESKDSLIRTLPWLCILARSGVEISSATFRWFATSMLRSHVDLRNTLVFVKALFASIWLRSLGQQDLQEVFSLLHSQLSAEVVHSLKDESNPVDALSIIRFSLASCLLIYGCIRDNIVELDLIFEQEIRDLPSRRRINFRGSYAPDPVVISPGILQALEIYVDVGNEAVTCLVAKFFNQFMADSPFLESYEVDNFILRNGKFLSTCAWRFYSIQHHELSSIRVNFLLRVLCVDPEPFQGLLRSLFNTPNTQQRLLALNVIFQVVLDVTSPSFMVDGRQWRSSVTEIFFHFFGAIWLDDDEEIRSAASTFSATLLPAHFEAMSLCWAESLAKAPIGERLKLACFLVQLRPHFATWKVLSWDVILESLVDYDDQHNHTVGASQSNQDGNNGALQETTLDEDSDITRLRVAIILLSLRMVADGIPIDTYTLMKIKAQVIQIAGFKQVKILPFPNSRLFRIQFGEMPEIKQVAIPCIEALTSVLDSHHILDLPGLVVGPAYDEDRASRFLVGAVFVDVSLAILSTGRELITLPVLTLKSILEGLYIIIHKYDLEHKAFVHLQSSLRRAVLRSLEFINQDISFEIRQLALSVTQAFLKRCHSFMGSVIYSALEQLARLISSHGQHDQDILAVQARLCLEFTLKSYCNSGLFIGLFKRNLDKSFFNVLDQLIGPEISLKGPFKSENLRDALLRDTLARFVDCDQISLQVVLNNLQSFIEVVHHRGYSADLILVTGQQLTHLARRMSDATGDLADPTPLFVIPALLIHHNKTYGKELLPYVDTVLRVALNRLDINITCLAQLIDVTSTLTRKHHLNASDVMSIPNSIVVVIFEILTDALKMKTRVQPSTLKVMLEVVFTPSSGFFSPLSANHKVLLDLMDNMIYFLRHHMWQDAKMEDDFVASLAIAKAIFRVADFNVLAFHKFLELGQEKNHRLSMDLRSWNIIVMAALLEPVQKWETLLLSNLSVFSSIYCGVLRSLGQSDAMADINHAFISLKLWVMLTCKASSGKIETMSGKVWNELWSPFQAFVDSLELDGQISSLTMLAISSVVDLLGFLRTVRSPIALKISTHASTLKRFKLSNHGESALAKLNRALKSIPEPPPSLQFDALLDQIAKEIIATEKLRLLEAKREVGKNVSDKKNIPERRRDGRIPT